MMTIRMETNCKLFGKHVGYAGQRYEVRYTDGDGKEKTAGWSEQADGGGIVRMINLHPVWHSPKIIDLRSDQHIGTKGVE